MTFLGLGSARIEERAHVNDGAGFLVRIMRGGNGDVSMPEKLRRRKDALTCYHDRARFFSQSMEGFVAFDAMRPQPAVHSLKDCHAPVTIPPGAGCPPAIARLASITNWPCALA